MQRNATLGKHLRRVRESSYPDWHNSWVDYKMLKRLIKVAATASAESPRAARVATAQDLASVPEERAFFSALLQNLTKVSSFYANHVAALRGGLLDLQAVVQSEPVPSVQTLAACRNLYTDMLILENYVVINYCAFSKILKKHDKNTGWDTREKYMRRMVNSMAFAHYPELRALVEEVECMFQQLAQQRPHAEVARPALGGEEQQALSALRELRAETQHLLPEEEDRQAAAAVAAACQGRPEEELVAIAALASAGRLVAREAAAGSAGAGAGGGGRSGTSAARHGANPAGAAVATHLHEPQLPRRHPSHPAMGPPPPVAHATAAAARTRRRRGSSLLSTSSEDSDDDAKQPGIALPTLPAPAAAGETRAADTPPAAKRPRGGGGGGGSVDAAGVDGGDVGVWAAPSTSAADPSDKSSSVLAPSVEPGLVPPVV